MGGFCKRGIDCRLVADCPRIADVVGCNAVHGGLGSSGRRRVDNRRQHLIVDVDQGGRRFGLGGRLGHHQRHLVADVAHLVLGEQGMLGLFHRTAVDRLDEPAAGQPADSGEILTREDREHARGAARRGRVDRADRRVRVGATQEAGVGLVRKSDVVGVLPGARQKAVVLLALDGTADEGGSHGVHGLALPMAFAAVATALTMFW